MRPISAVITAANKQDGLTVRLESGLVATLPYDKRYRKWQRVRIGYNFNKNEVVGILHATQEEEELS